MITPYSLTFVKINVERQSAWRGRTYYSLVAPFLCLFILNAAQRWPIRNLDWIFVAVSATYFDVRMIGGKFDCDELITCGIEVIMFRLKNFVAGISPLDDAVALNSRRLSSNFSKLWSFFFSRWLILFTADSAKPFDEGLYGEDVRCWIDFSTQSSLNFPLNWGPLSDMILRGYPCSKKIRFRQLQTASVDVELSLKAHGKSWIAINYNQVVFSTKAE